MEVKSCAFAFMSRKRKEKMREEHNGRIWVMYGNRWKRGENV